MIDQAFSCFTNFLWYFVRVETIQALIVTIGIFGVTLLIRKLLFH